MAQYHADLRCIRRQLGCVTKVVPFRSRQVQDDPLAMQAAQAEMKQLSVDKGAFDMGAFQEWDDVARKWPEARIVRFFLLMAIKHAQDAAKAKWKGRGVALGNNERNTFVERVIEDLMNVVPSS